MHPSSFFKRQTYRNDTHAYFFFWFHVGKHLSQDRLPWPRCTFWFWSFRRCGCPFALTRNVPEGTWWVINDNQRLHTLAEAACYRLEMTLMGRFGVPPSVPSRVHDIIKRIGWKLLSFVATLRTSKCRLTKHLPSIPRTFTTSSEKKILHQSCATRWKQYNSFGNRAFVADIFTKAVAA